MDDHRIVILEDVAKLDVGKRRVISAEAQLDTHKRQISFTDLLEAALSHAPDRIIAIDIAI
jgi:pilus assembly protein CpaF